MCGPQTSTHSQPMHTPSASADHNTPPVAAVPVQLALEELRQLQAQAAALRVDMPELSNLAVALERVDVWQVGCGREESNGAAGMRAWGEGEGGRWVAGGNSWRG